MSMIDIVDERDRRIVIQERFALLRIAYYQNNLEAVRFMRDTLKGLTTEREIATICESLETKYGKPSPTIVEVQIERATNIIAPPTVKQSVGNWRGNGGDGNTVTRPETPPVKPTPSARLAF
jgi:hypothetical protein